MSVVATMPKALVWRWRDPSIWTLIADIFAVLTALALPWSTTLVAIFIMCWLGAVAWVMNYRVYWQSLKRPICFLPLALVGLAIAGTLWSDASWNARLYAIVPTVKLLVLPGLFYHFERSARGLWVLAAFLLSCSLLMVVSWIVALDPGFSLKPTDEATRGIFVKNYIDQSQEFALCAVALVYPIVSSLRARQIGQALLLGALALSLLANMVFVIVSRTALVTMPVMLALFGMLHLKWRAGLLIFLAMLVLAGLAWIASPQLRRTTDGFFRQYQLYTTQNEPTSIGVRLEFLRKSSQFFVDAPVFGHGTGSTRGLFEQAASGSINSATRQVIGNPHNQTLNVAVQWGAIGVIALYAMWIAHLSLFRTEGLVAWIGLLVVVQNIFTSLFNSHLFDFHEGWMYVLGVGVAGGMTLRVGYGRQVAEPGRS